MLTRDSLSGVCQFKICLLLFTNHSFIHVAWCVKATSEKWLSSWERLDWDASPDCTSTKGRRTWQGRIERGVLLHYEPHRALVWTSLRGLVSILQRGSAWVRRHWTLHVVHDVSLNNTKPSKTKQTNTWFSCFVEIIQFHFEIRHFILLYWMIVHCLHCCLCPLTVARFKPNMVKPTAVTGFEDGKWQECPVSLTDVCTVVAPRERAQTDTVNHPGIHWLTPLGTHGVSVSHWRWGCRLPALS